MPTMVLALPAKIKQSRRRWWQSRRARNQAIAGYVLILPWVVGLVIFTAYPIAASAYYSMTDYSILNEPSWIGLQNYRTMVADPLFWQSLKVTAVFCVIVVPGGVAVGYLMAVLLNQKIRFLSVWRTIYFLPSIVPAVATSIIWAWIFNQDYGLITGFLRPLGLPSPVWFGSTDWVLPAFIIMTIWGCGGNLILYLAALQQVPTELYEAASIDGARAWQRLIHVTLPMTSPVILFTLITGTISSFQIFTAGYVITNGGPLNASLFYVLYLYRIGWQYYEMGYASALAWVLLIIMLGLTLLMFAASRRFVYYESS